MEKELISVLIPVLEENNLLLSCLQTIFEQDYPNIEIIISTKHEKINLGNFANDSRIRVIYTSEDDLAMMRSKAVEQAKGEFIVFLDPRGGLVGQDALTRMFYFIEEKNLDVFISNLTEFANNIFRIETGKNDILEEINPINYYFYLKRFRELCLLEGKLIRKSFAKLIDYGQSEQKMIEQLVKLKANVAWYYGNTFFWRKERGELPRYNLAETELYPPVLPKQAISEEQIPNEINILLCVDDNYCSKSYALLYSLNQTTLNKINVYLVYRELNTYNLTMMLKIAAQLDMLRIVPVKIDDYHYNQLKLFSLHNSKLPLSAYYRILATKLLPQVDRIIYLDIDMLVTADLTNLWQTPLGNNIIGACCDLPLTEQENSWSYQFLGSKGNKYFNSGMLVMNLAIMREVNFFEKITNFIQKAANAFVLDDQDALNYFLQDSVEIVDSKYNTILGYTNNITSEPVIVHYCGYDGLKPWELNPHVDSKMKVKYLNCHRTNTRDLLYKIANFPKVSIVIMGGLKEKRKLESLLFQAYPNFEIIILGDNAFSSEDFADIKYSSIESLAELVNAQGEYFFFLDGKDYLTKYDSLLNIMTVAINNHIDLLLTQSMELVEKEGLFYIKKESKQLIPIEEPSLTAFNDKHGNDGGASSGILCSKKDFVKFLNENELGIEKILQGLYERVLNKYYLEEIVWVKVE
ncbi:hypothetical protein SY111_20590 [Ligilactobacillus agilis]|uniref:Glycosyltransferase 2-like domain-containing protein n=1 Tax=Ligilactobacillus agilis TaxID=1601 RepID=A0A6F9XW89_9LACO|nr:glycosyltransferase [Ligilactobacillus agilis]GET09435.1 hypothetical protein SY111_20590 [Ligilactobacillus agilis]